MITVTLLDGSKKEFQHSITALQVAESISPRLAKATIAAIINDKLVDATLPIDQDVNVKLITDRDDQSLEIIRHSTAHLLAHAVKSLFPTAQVTIGPVIEDGFYYDFAFARPFTPDDLIRIEEKMHALAKEDLVVTRTVISREEAIKFFRGIGEEYKAKVRYFRECANGAPDLCRMRRIDVPGGASH